MIEGKKKLQKKKVFVKVLSKLLLLRYCHHHYYHCYYFCLIPKTGFIFKKLSHTKMGYLQLKKIIV